MNIRCAFCQTPYTLSRVEMLDALQEMEAHKLTHYDAHCPRCRRATQIPRQRMEMFFPNWRDALKEFEKEMKAHPQQEAPAPEPEVVPTAPAEVTPAPKAEKKATPKPAEKPAKTSAPKAITAPKEKAPAKPSASKPKAPAKKSK